MRAKGWEERLRELDEAAMAFRVAQRAAIKVQGSGEGWLRRVRRALDVPGEGVARRMGAVESQIYRMEVAEGRGAIELQTLRRAAEALGCELVYGLAPKEGTLTGMAAAIDARREQRRVEAKAQRREKEREQRYLAAEKAWEAQRQEREEAQRQGYWRAWRLAAPEGLRLRRPKGPPETGFGMEKLRKALRQALRKKGVRLR